MKKCSTCKIEKDVEDFYWKVKNSKRSGICKKCQKDYSKQHFDANQQYYKDKSKKNRPNTRLRGKNFIIEYLLQHPCVDCGNSDIEVLEFDHIEPLLNSKSIRVTQLIEYSVKRILEEIKKCEVRCANCHTKRTRKIAGTLRNKTTR